MSPLSRALKQRMHKAAPRATSPSGDARPGNANPKRTGLEQPETPTNNPRDLADPQARVIKSDD